MVWILCLLLACAVLTAPPAGAESLAVPVYNASGSTDSIFLVDLRNGRVSKLEPRSNGRVLREAAVGQNLFTTIGRQRDTPAAVGHFLVKGVGGRFGRTRALLLAETPTGYMAYLTRVGQGGQVGELSTIGGRPGLDMATADGNFALLPRTGDDRRTRAAYLYHGGSGKCLLLEGVDEEANEPSTRPCAPLPTLRLGRGVAALETSDGATSGYLVVDESDGTVYRLSVTPGRPETLQATATQLNLASVFPPVEGEAPSLRYALAPVRGGGGAVRAFLAADAHSGRMALVRDADGSLSAVLVPAQLRSVLDPDPGRRDLLLIPRVSGTGATVGVWVLDAGSRRALLVEDPGSPADLGIRSVEIRR